MAGVQVFLSFSFAKRIASVDVAKCVRDLMVERFGADVKILEVSVSSRK